MLLRFIACWTMAAACNVVDVASTYKAFAARKQDGAVVVWGNDEEGGDSSGVTDALAGGAEAIFANSEAFAVKLFNGSFVFWGKRRRGGNPPDDIRSQLEAGVETIYNNDFAFAAKLSTGAMVTWGDSDLGGNSDDVSAQLASGVQTIYSTSMAFTAKLSDGSLVAWGSGGRHGQGVIPDSVKSQLEAGVETVWSNSAAFAVKLSTGAVVTWGEYFWGGNSDDVSAQLASGVQNIYGVHRGFVATKEDGSIVAWGEVGSDFASVADSLATGVQTITATWGAFAALLSNGRVVTWGDTTYGADSSNVQDQLVGVQAIYSTSSAFAAKLSTGTVVTWGSERGGDSSAVKDELVGVEAVYSTDFAFAARKNDGTLVTWGLGDSRYGYGGGNTSALEAELRICTSTASSTTADVSSGSASNDVSACFEVTFSGGAELRAMMMQVRKAVAEMAGSDVTESDVEVDFQPGLVCGSVAARRLQQNGGQTGAFTVVIRFPPSMQEAAIAARNVFETTPKDQVAQIFAEAVSQVGGQVTLNSDILVGSVARSPDVPATSASLNQVAVPIAIAAGAVALLCCFGLIALVYHKKRKETEATQETADSKDKEIGASAEGLSGIKIMI